MVERVWVEVNARVNYPIKHVLIDMMESGDFSLDDDRDKFCVSWFAIKVAAVGIELFVASWNEHPIPGITFRYLSALFSSTCTSVNLAIESELTAFYVCTCVSVTKRGSQRGVPRVRMLGNNHAKTIDQRLLPSTTDAVQQYQQQGGQLTDPWQVGKDPLDGNAYKYGVRHEAFLKKYPSFQDIFSKLVNGDQTTFKHALKFYIDITHRISST